MRGLAIAALVLLVSAAIGYIWWLEHFVRNYGVAGGPPWER